MKTRIRFFGGMLMTQANWLNKMSEKGYRLVRTDKLRYEFEECEPNQMKYCVEFIGHLSKDDAREYHDFLEEMGYRVFYKNINLNYSIGKVRLRPWAKRGGRVTTDAGTFHRELLIVEKEKDGKFFELHTTYEDRAQYYRILQKPWLFLLFMFTLFAVFNRSMVFWIFAVLALIPVLIYQREIGKMRREGQTKEWR